MNIRPLPFVAGQPATVMTRDRYRRGAADEPIRTLTVKRVMKLWIECDDGSKWYLDGGKYPRERRSYLDRERIVPGTTADIELRARANQAREWLSRRDPYGHNAGPRGLSDAAALAIVELWKQDMAARGAE